MIERPSLQESLSLKAVKAPPPKSLMQGNPASLQGQTGPPVHGSICYRQGRRIGVWGVTIPIIDSLYKDYEP